MDNQLSLPLNTDRPATEALYHWKQALAYLNAKEHLKHTYTHATIRSLTNALQKAVNAEEFDNAVFSARAK